MAMKFFALFRQFMIFWFQVANLQHYVVDCRLWEQGDAQRNVHPGLSSTAAMGGVIT